QDCFELIGKPNVPGLAFRFNDLAGQPIQVRLRTISDGSYHSLQNIGIHAISPFLVSRRTSAGTSTGGALLARAVGIWVCALIERRDGTSVTQRSPRRAFEPDAAT